MKRWNNNVYSRLRKILCEFKEQAMARPSGEKYGLTHYTVRVHKCHIFMQISINIEQARALLWSNPVFTNNTIGYSTQEEKLEGNTEVAHLCKQGDLARIRVCETRRAPTDLQHKCAFMVGCNQLQTTYLMTRRNSNSS